MSKPSPFNQSLPYPSASPLRALWMADYCYFRRTLQGQRNVNVTISGIPRIISILIVITKTPISSRKSVPQRHV